MVHSASACSAPPPRKKRAKSPSLKTRSRIGHLKRHRKRPLTPEIMGKDVERILRSKVNYRGLPPRHHRSQTVFTVSSGSDDLSSGRVRYLQRISGTREEKNGEWKGVKRMGETFWVGDGVVVRTTKGQREGFIRRVVQVDGSKGHFHLHWLKRLNIGASHQRFLEDRQCADVKFKHVQRNMKLTLVQPAEKPPKHSPFCRLVAQADHRLRDPLPDRCDSCQTQLVHQGTQQAGRIPNGFRIGAQVYHIHDFVMIDPEFTGEPYVIGQIRSFSIGRASIQVQTFGRRGGSYTGGFKDERKLYLSHGNQTFIMGDIRGKCFVSPSPVQPTAGSSAFWCSDLDSGSHSLSRNFKTCDPCLAEQIQKEMDDERIAGQLCFADYYSGVGGGVLSATPYFEIVSAVDCDPTACKTLRRNGMAKTICNATLEDLHRRERELVAGFKLGQSSKTLEEHGIPRLPRRGSVVGMMAGVPCQGHSRVNRYQAPDDNRNKELFWFISEVDRVQPAYVILENVPGFKDERNDGTFVDGSTASFAHMAMNLLVEHDYQCQLAILDSRSYESPQNRSRLWIIAARRGVPFPNFPLPTHANPEPKQTVFTLDPGTKAVPVGVGSGTPGTGPFSAITVGDAIDDLPRFDFSSPYFHPRHHVPALTATGTGPEAKIGFVNKTSYRTPPLTTYQRAMRGERTGVRDHYTPSRSPAEIQQCHEAFAGGHLPGNLSHSDKNGGFSTLMTFNAPGRRATRPIHYCQFRTKTVAEDKRAMGFPDSYVIKGTPKQQVAQLGNAWVVQMGQAIVREIRNAIRDDWVKDNRPPNIQNWWNTKYPVPSDTTRRER